MGLSGVSRRDALGRTTDLTLMPSLNVGLSGVEPLTSRLSGVRSNQLSYRPIGVNSKLKVKSAKFKSKVENSKLGH